MLPVAFAIRLQGNPVIISHVLQQKPSSKLGRDLSKTVLESATATHVLPSAC